MASANTSLKIEAIVNQFFFVWKQAMENIWRIEKTECVD